MWWCPIFLRLARPPSGTIETAKVTRSKPMAEATELEPANSCVTGRRSNQQNRDMI
jgi:hypothetical protein